MRAYILFKIIAVLCGLIITANVASARDTLAIPAVRTLGLTVYGTALIGPGIAYDHSFANKQKGYAYWRAELSFPFLWEPGLFPCLGSGYCRSISKNKKFFVGVGLNVGTLIAFKPTPKTLRDYWDSIDFYGGNYVYPVELFVIPELNMSYIAKRWFIRLELTPLLVYDRVGEDRIRVVPWAGVTIGLRIGKK